jgi:hypothetical protein
MSNILLQAVRLACLTLSVVGCVRRTASHLEPICPPAMGVSRITPDRSEPNAILGQLVDRDTGRPLSQGLVLLSPGDRRLLSDSLGTFAIRGLSAGQYAVVVRRLGYEGQTDTVVVHDGAGVRARVALTPAAVDRCMEMRQVRDRFRGGTSGDANRLPNER